MASQPPTSARIEDLKARLRLDPKSRLFYPLAEDLRKAGRADEAEKVLRDGLEHHGTYLSAWMSLGRVLVEKGEHREATEVLMRALALDPGNVVCARLLANSYLALGETLEAVKKFKLVRALLPADEEVEEQIERLERQLDAERAGTFPPPAPPPEMPSRPAEVDSPRPPEQARSAPERPPEPAESEPFLEAPPLPDFPAPQEPSEDRPPGGDQDVFTDRTFAGESPGPGGADWQDSPAASAEAPVEEPERAAFSEGESSEPAQPIPTLEEPFGSDAAADEGEAAVGEEEWDEEPRDEPRRAADELTATLTMADLYARQGHVEAAREIYRKVLERDPGNAQVREKLERTGSAPAGELGRRSDSVKRLEGWLEKVARRDV